MEEANHGGFDVGAKTVGLNISLPHEQYPNPYVTTDLFFSFHYFALRSLHFPLRAKALVAFPGGYGTFDELFEVLTLIERTIKPIPVVLVGESYWQAVRYRGWTENIALRLASADAKSFQLDRVPTRP